ncbi:hypothetical protein OF83DRAFT_1174104 [Amylostereum chailletii]|nr:hypothetical protein OF83DRAFT_1174104 [Amylostereum chailletii]
MGFGAIFAGGATMLASGDAKNGSGVMTSWTLSYLLVDQFAHGLTKAERLPRHPVSYALMGAAGLGAAVYGLDYFSSDDDDDDEY